ncbi:hypothetical protein KIH23_13250 [Flavobacterium sp. CYK-55]|uniref:hypothetical protein n=1 Tax=Flavobacterium sp. CYK-55 TaxID=2835529 RepID=UPI001BD0AE2C|nr:hypothetical protein [Flavobacterium sp. CYK-55]MBS7788268.1 hypothetical protein [Flavobacterium sp. CYK-55]
MKKVITILASALLVVTSAMASDTNSNHKVSAKNSSSEKTKLAPIVDEPILIPQLEINHVPTDSLREMIHENNKIIESAPVDSGWLVLLETPVEQIITENQQITEDQSDNKVYPLFLDRTIEDQIAEDNAIIEANIQL